MQSAGWKVESDARSVINAVGAMKAKAAFLTPMRKKSSISVVTNNHYWLVCYKGTFDATNARPFGMLDKTATLKSTALLGCPVIPSLYRLVDEKGEVINPYEKHMSEAIEQLARFMPTEGTLLDFCAGTCSAGLASLYMNQRHIVLVDRDANVLRYAEARLRAYLWAMMQSPLYDADDDRVTGYRTPGVDVHRTWDGQDPYRPLLVASKVVIKQDKVLVPPHNIPRGTKRNDFASLYDCVVGPSQDPFVEDEGVYITSEQEKGTMYPLFGEYKRRPCAQKANQINSVILRPRIGERKPYYMRPTDECPFKFVRDPKAVIQQLKEEDPDADVTEITANCQVMELQCSMDQINKVVIVLLQDLKADSNDPTELLCSYDIAKLEYGWKAVVPSTQRNGNGVKAKLPDGDSEDENETVPNDEEETVPEEEPVKKKRKKRRGTLVRPKDNDASADESADEPPSPEQKSADDGGEYDDYT
jgi:hypothetical protein